MDELARLKQKCNKLLDIIKTLEEENKTLKEQPKVTASSDTAKILDKFAKLNEVYNYIKSQQKLVVRKAKFEDIDYTEFKKLTSEYFSNEDEFLDFMKFLKMFNFIETASDYSHGLARGSSQIRNRCNRRMLCSAKLLE